MQIFKLLWLIARFNDVTEAAREASPDGKPFYLTQRFWGAVVTLGSGVLAYIGIKAEVNQDAVTNQLVSFATAAVPVITMLYGLALHIKGWYDANRRNKLVNIGGSSVPPKSNVIDANVKK
jgi:hypothetical protein